MTIRNWLLGSITVLVAAACLILPFIPQATLPFESQPVFSQSAYRIHASSIGIPLPPELKDGDMSPIADMDTDMRMAISLGNGNTFVDTPMDVPVWRDGGVQHVTVHFVKVAPSGEFLAGIYVGYALLMLMAALGLLLLWRGTSRAASGVAVWCFTGFVSGAIGAVPFPLFFGGIINFLGAILGLGGTLAGLYLVADGLTAETLGSAVRRRWRNRFAAALGLYLALVVGYNGHAIVTGKWSLLANYVIVWVHIWTFIVPLIVLLIGYRVASALDRARIRWVLLSLSVLLLAYMLGFMSTAANLPQFWASVVVTLLTAVAFISFAYAVLRHRLVSLQLVLNRALVYGLITSLVVGVFAALLAFLERSTVNSQTNQFLALLIPLLLGMGINTLKRKVDEYINSALFRHRHKAIASLTHFSRSAAFVDDPERLLDLTADELYRNSRSQGVAIYLGKKGKTGPMLVRHQGPLPFSPKVSNDDLALLRLKAGDPEVDLHGTFSALGSEGYAYALTVRGELLGFIVMGPRPAEAYTQEERRLYAQVAQQTAVTLHTLRLHEQQKLLQAIAKGSYKSLPKARAKAKELIDATA